MKRLLVLRKIGNVFPETVDRPVCPLSRMLFHLHFVLLLFYAAGALALEQKPVRLEYARGFEVQNHSGCRLVTIRAGWKESGRAFRYLLVPRGTVIPREYPPAQVIFVPVERVVSLSTTHLAYMDAAGMTDRLVGLSGFKYVNTPSVRRRIDAGELKEVGQFTNLNIETLIDLAPDLILASASGSIYDEHPKIMEAGLPVVLVIDHLEAHPLGRVEWIKFLSLFFDTTEHAGQLFKEIEARYTRIAKIAANAASRPMVITGAPFQGQWWVPGKNSFVARFVMDAGAELAFPAFSGSGSRPMAIEAVYEKALKAQIWLNVGNWQKIQEAKDADPRFSTIPALLSGQVYNNNKRLNQWGGNDFWESGVLRPDAILADLLAILHPDLMPDHELVYYQPLAR